MALELRKRRLLWLGAGLLLVLIAATAWVLAGLARGGWYTTVALADLTTLEVPTAADEALAASPRQPRGPYVVVDSYRNRLRVLNQGEVLRDTVCSTGSGRVLRDPQRGRIWIFDTPLGEHQVREKRRNPVWVKPDWAFIEEGFEPPKDAGHRVDPISLGDYGLYLGDGYLIHGTLFQTLLGRKITHGCIRLGDEDLEYVYHTVPLGARVYIY